MQVQIEPDFLNDKQVARKLSLSDSWVRGQRHKRNKGLPHTLTVDAKYIGKCPRYLRGEIDAFVASIAAA
ncbi:hypothetical protein Sphch_0743 [Sphingobium chlorophenolicum L-1]|uniref:Uncharacterized protein n=1 Tax=Sphingobium chlorophenolicum L-1 TaxID=690566 RepID=F6EZG2_SPHCR|nr:hypothetical protein [Sphingobium chlorophenolicum]AEG48438.1 hypothetical protein Sphch_0743 [Sphingobium chlorophenolicum L-1]